MILYADDHADYVFSATPLQNKCYFFRLNESVVILNSDVLDYTDAYGHLPHYHPLVITGVEIAEQYCGRPLNMVLQQSHHNLSFNTPELGKVTPTLPGNASCDDMMVVNSGNYVSETW